MLIDGHSVFRVGPTAEVDAGDRARLIERRIDLLLASPDQIAPAVVEVLPDDEGTAVTVAGVTVVVVTQEDADDNLTTVDSLADSWAESLDTALTSAAARRRSPVTSFLTQVRAAFTAAFVRLFDATLDAVPRVLAAVLVLILFGIAARLVRGLLSLLFRSGYFEPTVGNLVRQLVYVGIWVAGVLAAMAALGFDPQTVVAGLGLTSLALGFGLRDIVSNYISGVLLLAMRPFRLRDWIEVGGTEGTVQQIDLRATHIRTFDGQVVLVPNGEVFSGKIVKNTAPLLRTRVVVPLPYDTDLDYAVEVAAPVVAAVPGVVDNPMPKARIGDLGSGGADLTILYWADPNTTSLLDLGDHVRREVVAALRAAGIRLPNPEVRYVVQEQEPPGSNVRPADETREAPEGVPSTRQQSA